MDLDEIKRYKDPSSTPHSETCLHIKQNTIDHSFSDRETLMYTAWSNYPMIVWYDVIIWTKMYATSRNLCAEINELGNNKRPVPPVVNGLHDDTDITGMFA